MSFSRRIMLLLRASSAVALLIAAPELVAQTPGRNQPSEVLRRLDTNGDGVLQPDEVPQRARPILRQMAQRSGVDPNGPLPIDRLAGRSEPEGESDERPSRGEGRPRTNDSGSRDGRDTEGEENDRGDRNFRGRGEEDDDRRRWDWRDDDRPRQQPAALSTKVPGFGVDLGLVKVPGFDVPHSVTSQSGPSVSELEQSIDRRVIWFARRMLEGADENGNQIVDPAEWDLLRLRGDANELDANKDGRLTLPEMIQGLERQRATREASRNRENGPRGPAGGDQPPGARPDRPVNSVESQPDEPPTDTSPSKPQSPRGSQAEQREQEASDRPSGRSGRATRSDRNGRSQRSGRDRAPGWFRSRDRNGDGQVSMAEYATRWDDRMVAEFKSRDPDGDGVISLREATR